MARYQNIFTQIQLRSAPEMGVPLPHGDWARDGKPGSGLRSRLMSKRLNHSGSAAQISRKTATIAGSS